MLIDPMQAPQSAARQRFGFALELGLKQSYLTIKTQLSAIRIVTRIFSWFSYLVTSVCAF
jgi:hypothetical protein